MLQLYHLNVCTNIVAVESHVLKVHKEKPEFALILNSSLFAGK